MDIFEDILGFIVALIIVCAFAAFFGALGYFIVKAAIFFFN